MNLRNHVRTLAMGSMLALAVLSVPAVNAHAEKNQHPVDNGVRCSFQNPRNGEWLFFLPGETITLTDGLGYSYTLVCGGDGNWTIASRDSSSAYPVTALPIGNASPTQPTPTPTGPISPLPTSGILAR
jgi:hypothetical protein